MGDLNKLTITAARDGLRAKDFTARELTQSCVDAAEASGSLNAYSVVTADQALEMADAADVRLARVRSWSVS